MAGKISIDVFMTVVQQSGLIDEERLESSLAEMTAAKMDITDPVALANEWIKRGMLTPWQAEKLLQGRHKGFRLGKYRLITLLGRGGMSAVYLAEHLLMRRRCAIKVLPMKRAQDTAYLNRFHLEAQAVAALDHPNIVRAYDVDSEFDGSTEIHFLVMEFVEGRSLADVVHDDGPLAPAVAADYLRQAANGLSHAHASEMVHRDIKPANLLVDNQGVVKILDLGLARFFGDRQEGSLSLENEERVLGTADYLSPEQALDSHQVDFRTDIYSLGCTGFFLLTGRPPFDEGSLAQRLLAHQKKRPPSIVQMRPEVPSTLVAIIEKMMAKRPQDRHQSAEEAAKVLEEWLANKEGAASAAPEVRPKTGLKSPPTQRLDQVAEEVEQLRAGVGNKEGTGIGARRGEVEPELSTFLSGLAGGAKVAGPAPGAASGKSPPGVPPKKSRPPLKIPTASGAAQGAGGVGPGNVVNEPPRFLEEVIVEDEEGASPKFAIDTSVGIDTQSSSTISRTGSRSSSRLGKKKSSPLPALLLGASLVGMTTLAMVFFSPWNKGAPPKPNGGDPRKASTTEGKTSLDEKEKEKSKEVTRTFDPATVGNEVHVGTNGTFKKISDAISHARQYFKPQSDSDTFKIILTGGETFAEPIRIDNSDFSFPKGVQILCEDMKRKAVIAPLGLEAAVRLDNLSNFRLQGIIVQPKEAQTAVELSGYFLNSTVQDVEIKGTRKTGIHCRGAAGLTNRPLSLVNVTVRTDVPTSVGVLVDTGSANAAEIELQGCRFVGPFRAGIECTTSVSDLRIRQSIFHGAQVGIRFTGINLDLVRVLIANCTFSMGDVGIAFHTLPGRGSGLEILRNLFYRLKKRESGVEEAFDRERMSKILSSEISAHDNWTERNTDRPGEGEIVICSGDGKSGLSGLQFRSTNASDTDFLKPGGVSMSPPLAQDGRLLPYIGAVAP